MKPITPAGVQDLASTEDKLSPASVHVYAAHADCGCIRYHRFENGNLVRSWTDRTKCTQRSGFIPED